MTKMTRKQNRKSNRKGFAVVELMVGMVVLAVGLLGVAGMTVTAARKATGISAQSSRDGIVLQELNKLGSLPYDSLSARAGCTTSASTNAMLAYKRCITVTDITGGTGYKRVRLIVAPTSGYSRADTVYLNRAKGTATNPLGQ
jgi:prepilin-type N-terminal cleavage/methylation domain-containing protein